MSAAAPRPGRALICGSVAYDTIMVFGDRFANHIKRYWEPRMRAQMLKYYEERDGAGLSELAKSAVALLHAASQAPPATPGTAGASGAAGAPAKGAGT